MVLWYPTNVINDHDLERFIIFYISICPNFYNTMRYENLFYKMFCISTMQVNEFSANDHNNEKY